jgi:hypothetical protein
MDYQIQWLDSAGQPEGSAVTEPGVALSNSYFTATIVKDNPSGTISQIQIASSEYNKSDDEYSSTLRLTANQTTADIVIIKESPSRYSNRIFQVLTVGESYGNLGSYSTTPSAANGRAMRYVLDNQFSPTSSYPFKIGGFSFWRVAVGTYTNVTSDADINLFRRMIASMDVLVLTYHNTISENISSLLLDEWLVQKPNRVLWIFRDDNNTNATLLTATKNAGDGEWHNINGYSSSAGFRTSAPSDYAYDNANEIAEFFDGPFGSMPHDMILNTQDGVLGSCVIGDARKTVTPLVYNNNSSNKDEMILGINKRKGVVYCGESEFFSGGTSDPMSSSANSNGTLDPTTTNSKNYLDVMNANIWAWIVGRVIYGPQPDL